MNTKLLVGMLMMVCLLAIPATAWWDEGWQYRKCVNLTYTEHSYEPVRINLSMICTGGEYCLPDFDDIRVIDEGNNSLQYELVDSQYHNSTPYYWLYFLAPNTSQEYCIYYGNPLATSVSNNSLFYLIEEFDEDIFFGQQVSKCIDSDCNWVGDYCRNTTYGLIGDGTASLQHDEARCANSYWNEAVNPQTQYNFTLPFIALQKSHPSYVSQYLALYFGWAGHDDTGSIGIEQANCGVGGGGGADEGWLFRIQGVGSALFRDSNACNADPQHRIFNMNVTASDAQATLKFDDETLINGTQTLNYNTTISTAQPYHIIERHDNADLVTDYIYLVNAPIANAYNTTPNQPIYPECVPIWNCSSFSDCDGETRLCLAVEDLLGCGETFGGLLSEYDEECELPPITGYVAQYSTSDVGKQVVDGLGTAGVELLSLMGLLVFGCIIGFLIWVKKKNKG